MRSATLRAASLTGFSPRGASVDLHSRLLLHLSARRSRTNPLSAGFTLVELMIVIAIVGILSAIAIPNFLKQSEKAKATEAKSAMSAILKQAQAQYLEDGVAPRTAIADMTTLYGAPVDATQKFNYAGHWSSTTSVYSVTARGNTLGGNDIKDKYITGCVNALTGVQYVGPVLTTTNVAPTSPTGSPQCTGSTPAQT